ncbi:MAG: M23 family metallopeptidase [Flavobacteriaceae bacterium]
MKDKVNIKRKFIQKLRNPYLVMIIDEETFEEKGQIRISRLKTILVSFLLICISSVFIFTIISYSPLKEYIPGYDSSEIRAKAIQNLFLTDSLIQLYDQNLKYLNSVKKVITEDISLEEQSALAQTQRSLIIKDELNTQSVLEDSLLRVFVSQQDKYSPVSRKEIELNTFLFQPVKGQISQPFDRNKSHYAVDIAVEKNTPIKAIADGTVIFSEWTSETGYVIILEHNFGLLSVYKHNSSLNKRQGNSVLSGEVIATAGNTGEYTTGYHLHFELWMDGYPMDPENFFNFSAK